jgi:hypothetical protein
LTIDGSNAVINRPSSSSLINPKSKIQNPKSEILFGLQRMRFSRMQLVGALAVLLLIWAVIFYRLAFSAS